MKHRYQLIITIFATMIVAAITALWSWNTLADLFGWPAAEFRHVLAAFLLLGTLRFAGRGRKHRHGRRHAGHPMKAADHHGT
jgi:hypothetical protein